MAVEDKKRAAFRGLVDRVLTGEGKASVEERARAFSNDGLAPPVDALIGKIARTPVQVSDADFAAARESGLQRGSALRVGGLRCPRPVGSAV